MRSFTGRVISAISALIASYSITSTLTLEESGLFFLTLGFVIFLSHILRYGLDNYVLKKCAIYISDVNPRKFLSVVIVSVLFCILASFLLFLALLSLANIIPYEYIWYLVYAFPIAVMAALLGIIAHSLHASGFVFMGSVTDTSLNYLLFSILVTVLTPLDAVGAIKLFALACSIALVFQVVLCIYAYKSNGIATGQWKTVRLKDTNHKEMYETSLPLWIVVIAQQLNQWSAQFISSIYVSEQQIAVLAIAMRIALLVPMVLNAVNMVVSPQFAALQHKKETEKTEEVLSQSLKLLAVVCTALFIFIILFGEKILRIFGEEYTVAAGLLSILVCGQLVNALTGPCGKLLMMSGYEKDFRNVSIAVAAAGVLLGLILTSLFGLYGAAIATSVTIASQNITLAYLVKHRLNINLVRIYAKILHR